MNRNSSRKWSSVTNVNKPYTSESISTVVEYKLWEKHPDIQYLDKACKEFVWRTAQHFSEKNLMYETLKKSVNHYTRDFGFNILMLLNRYMSMTIKDNAKNISAKVLSSVQEQWQKQVTPLLSGHCRLFAHLCANFTTDRDLVVYRGIRNKREITNAQKGKDILEDDFRKLQAISNIEVAIKSMMKYPENLQDWIVEGYVNKFDLISIDNYDEAEMLLNKLIEVKVNLNLIDRDLSKLISGVGEEVELESFSSTSFSKEQAKKFVDDYSGCCLLQIQIPKGSPLFYATAFSSFTGEDSEFEVVLPPCSRFVVLGRSGGITRLRYLGISEIAKKRMTLDLSRLYVLFQMMQAVYNAQDATIQLKSFSGIGYFELCKKLDRHATRTDSLRNGWGMQTFSNSVMKDTWSTADEQKYKYDPKWEPEDDNSDDGSERKNSEDDEEFNSMFKSSKYSKNSEQSSQPPVFRNNSGGRKKLSRNKKETSKRKKTKKRTRRRSSKRKSRH